MNEYGRELAGWMATLEGGSPFSRRLLASEVLKARADTLRTDLASLASKGVTEGPGVQAAQDLLALYERAQ